MGVREDYKCHMSAGWHAMSLQRWLAVCITLCIQMVCGGRAVLPSNLIQES